MTAALEVGEWSAARLAPGKDPVPILQETGWAPGPVWTGGKSRRLPTGIRSQTVQTIHRMSYPAHTPVDVFPKKWWRSWKTDPPGRTMGPKIMSPTIPERHVTVKRTWYTNSRMTIFFFVPTGDCYKNWTHPLLSNTLRMSTDCFIKWICPQRIDVVAISKTTTISDDLMKRMRALRVWMQLSIRKYFRGPEYRIDIVLVRY